MVFFCFLTCSFFFHFISFGLRPSGLGFHLIFFVFRLVAPVPNVAFGLGLSCLAFEGFFLFVDLQFLFPCYCLWFKALGSMFSKIFFVFRLATCFSISFRLV